MGADIENPLVDKVRGLSPNEKRKVLEFIDNLGESEASRRDDHPIGEVIAEISASVPDEEWAKLPTDGAEQHDHYLYGSPKRQS